MSGKQPMDMITYYRLFGMTRMPEETTDIQTFNPHSKHIIVAHNKNVSNNYQRFTHAVIGSVLELDDNLADNCSFILMHSIFSSSEWM